MNIKDFIREGRSAADITPLLADANVFHYCVTALGELFAGTEYDLIAAVEGRGFIFGAALAYKMNKGMVLLRKPKKLQNEVYTVEYTDYSGKVQTLEIHKDNVREGQRILIIDDWVESGGTIKAGISLIEKCKGKIVGIGVLMDDSNSSLKEELAKYNYKFLDYAQAKDN